MAEGFRISVESNAPGLAEAFQMLAERQLPFATAVALTRVAQDAQEGVRRDMPHRFKLRGSRLLKGVQITRAEKRDWPNPKAQVGSRDEFMVTQELGGERRPQKGASFMAIPTRVVTSQRTSTGGVPRRLKPRNVNKARKIPGDRIVAPLSKGKSATGKKLDEASFWLLRRRVKIKPRFRLRETVEGSVESTYPKRFEEEFAAAMKSARAKAGKFTSEQARAFYLQARDANG